MGPLPEMLYVNGRGAEADFGAVRTAGACRLMPDKRGLLVTAAPEGGRFELRIRADRLPWKSAQPRQAEALGENGEVRSTVPLRREAGDVILDYDGGVFAYRLN